MKDVTKLIDNEVLTLIWSCDVITVFYNLDLVPMCAYLALSTFLSNLPTDVFGMLSTMTI